jgi:predicted DNA-binding transcriptional regulator AlpA
MNKSSVEIVQIEPLAVRPKQAAALIGVSLRKFHSMRACGLLPPAYKLGGCLVYRTSDLKQWSAWGFPCLDKFLALQKGDKK